MNNASLLFRFVNAKKCHRELEEQIARGRLAGSKNKYDSKVPQTDDLCKISTEAQQRFHSGRGRVKLWGWNARYYGLVSPEISPYSPLLLTLNLEILFFANLVTNRRGQDNEIFMGGVKLFNLRRLAGGYFGRPIWFSHAHNGKMEASSASALHALPWTFNPKSAQVKSQGHKDRLSHKVRSCDLTTKKWFMRRGDIF